MSSSSPTLRVAVGDRVFVSSSNSTASGASREGTVRFVGETDFAQGEWVGIELNNAEGKNNGSVQGKSYFECEKNHGLFVRKFQVRHVKERKAPNRMSLGAGVSGRGKIPIPSPVSGMAKPSASSSSAAGKKLDAMREKRRQSEVGSLMYRKERDSKRVSDIGLSASNSRPSIATGSSPSAADSSNARSAASKVPTPISSLAARRASSVGTNQSGSSSLSTPRIRSSSTSPSSLTEAKRELASAKGIISDLQSQLHKANEKASASQTEDSAKFKDLLSIKEKEVEELNSKLLHAVSSSSSNSETQAKRFAEMEKELRDAKEKLESVQSKMEVDSAALLSKLDAKNEEINVLEARIAALSSASSSEVQKKDAAFASMQKRQQELETELAESKTCYESNVAQIREEADRLMHEARMEVELLEGNLEEEKKNAEDLRLTVKETDAELSTIKLRVSELCSVESKRIEELAQARGKVMSAERRAEDLEKQTAELQEMVEMMALDKETLEMDKEIAEERAEELEQQLERMQVSNSLDGNSSSQAPDGSDAAEENNKLRAAIKALHERSSSEKNELQRNLRLKEKELVETAEIASEVISLREKNEKNSIEIRELKEMLDVANVYEVMVEELTDKNLKLGDRNTELENAVRSLEELKEMSDEMEEQHQEYERELLEDISQKETSVLELERQIRDLYGNVEDKERTILQFRELVTRTRAELSQLKHQLRSESTERVQMEKQNHAALNANASLKLQELRQTELSTELRLKEIDMHQLEMENNSLKICIPEHIRAKDERTLHVRLSVFRVRSKFHLLSEHVSQIIQRTLTLSGGEQTDRPSMDGASTEEIKGSLFWIKKIEQYFEDLQHVSKKELEVGSVVFQCLYQVSLAVEKLEAYGTSEEEILNLCKQAEAALPSLEKCADSMVQELVQEGSLSSAKDVHKLSAYHQLIDCTASCTLLRQMRDELVPSEQNTDYESPSFIMKLAGLSRASQLALSVSQAKLTLEPVSGVLNLLGTEHSTFIPLIVPFTEAIKELKDIGSQVFRLLKRVEDELALQEEDRDQHAVRGADFLLQLNAVQDQSAVLVEAISNVVLPFHNALENALLQSKSEPFAEFPETMIQSIRAELEDSVTVHIKSMHLQLNELSKSIQKGYLTDILSNASELKESTDDPQHSYWHVRASETRKELSLSDELHHSLEKTTNEKNTLSYELRNLSREFEKATVLKSKLEFELEEEKTRVAALKAENKEITVKLVKERDDLDKIVHQNIQQREKMEEDNRSLKKKLRDSIGEIPSPCPSPSPVRLGRRSGGIVREGDAESGTVAVTSIINSSEMEALRRALAMSRESLYASRTSCMKNTMESLGALPVEHLRRGSGLDLTSCSKQMNSLAKNVTRRSLPSLVDMSSTTSCREQLMSRKLDRLKLRDQFEKLHNTVQRALVNSKNSAEAKTIFCSPTVPIGVCQTPFLVGTLHVPRPSNENNSKQYSSVKVTMNHREMREIQSIFVQ